MRNGAQEMLEIRKRTEAFGAEATGIDLTRPIDPGLRARLNDAAVQQDFPIIKGQSFDARQFLAAGRLFSEPMSRPDANPLPDLPRVQRRTSRDRLPDGEVLKTGHTWHTDQTDEERPPKHTILYAVELFRTGDGTTGIVDMRSACDTLPGPPSARIECLKAVYGAPRTATRGPDALRGQRGAGVAQVIVHTLVRSLPETGRKVPHLHPRKFHGIVGVSDEKAKELLAGILQHALDPRFVHNHAWTLGDMLLWDNRSTLHRADYDYDPADTTQHRFLSRMRVEGERPQ